MRFGLQLDKLKHIPHEEFEELNWLPVSCRFKYCVSSITLRYFNEQPKFALSYIDPTFWNKTLDILKRTTNSNALNRQT